MDTAPKILVGTMACGEKEFPACQQAIAAQKYVIVKHYVIENKPEIVAHQELFQYWNENRSDFDLFVKIDADTVLEKDDSLFKLWKIFSTDSEISAVQTGLLDYFSNQMISGLNSFSPEVSFSIPTDPLFCDRIEEVGHKKILKPKDTLDIFPIARHCLYPSPKQAFHFGYRRWSKGQLNIVRNCLDAWKNAPETGRLWALLGVRASFHSRIEDASYNNPEFVKMFDKAEQEYHSPSFDHEKISKEIEHILSGYLPLRLKRFIRRSLPLLQR